MTVKELRDLLESLPQDKPIGVFVDDIWVENIIAREFNGSRYVWIIKADREAR